MALVRRRVINPAPAILALVNSSTKKRGKQMATRRRKRRGTRRASARRNPVNPVNPTRRARRRGRRRTVYARRRNPINPTRRRRYGRRRRRNPNITSTAFRAIPLVLGSAAIGMAVPIVGPLVARFAPQLVATPIGAAGVTFGTGLLVSMVAKAFAFTRRYADDVLLAGAVLAGGQLFTAYVAPMIPRLGMGRRNGMRGIGVMTGIPPHVLPPPPPANGNGMKGIGAYPGQYAR